MGYDEGVWYCEECGDGPYGNWNPCCSACPFKRGFSEQYSPYVGVYERPASRPETSRHTISTSRRTTTNTPSTTASNAASSLAPQTTSGPALNTGVRATNTQPTALPPSIPFSRPDNFNLVEELATLFWEAPYLKDSIRNALAEKRIDGNQLERKLRRQLKRMASDLKAESSNQKQVNTAQRIFDVSDLISSAIRVKADPILVTPSELDKQSAARIVQLEQSVLKQMEARSDDSACASSSEENTDEDDNRLNLPSALRDGPHMRSFVLESSAFVTFLEQLHEYAHPKLKILLLKCVDRIARRKTQSSGWITTARALANEFDEVHPSTIRTSQELSLGILEKLQARVEACTSQSWDWWPFNPPRTPQGMAIEWTCSCGELRRIQVPKSLGELITKLSTSLASTGGTGTNSVSAASPARNLASSSQSSQAAAQSGSGMQFIPLSSQGLQQPQNSATVLNPTIPSYQSLHNWVLLVVQSRGDYHVAQINIYGLVSNTFFRKLRSEYFRLRGVFCRYFSVWGFSHCDFYKFEKFDEYAIAPRHKNEYPDPQNREYDYRPKPMVEMPPITEHEFKKRFYSCASNPFHVRCHTRCHCTKLKKQAHNREIIGLLPKKLSQLDDGGDQREFFWGLYARQEIHFWRVLVYNAICISPLAWFFFMWVFHWGHEGDMQNASVPLMVMLSLLSMFWTTFITSLRLV